MSSNRNKTCEWLISVIVGYPKFCGELAKWHFPIGVRYYCDKHREVLKKLGANKGEINMKDLSLQLLFGLLNRLEKLSKNHRFDTEFGKGACAAYDNAIKQLREVIRVIELGE